VTDLPLKRIADRIREDVATASKLLLGRDAVLRTMVAGRYDSRRGKIDGVIPDITSGIMVLVMIYRVGTREVLNSEPKTRTFWPLSSVEVVW
jgi:hypothetical protein